MMMRAAKKDGARDQTQMQAGDGQEVGHARGLHVLPDIIGNGAAQTGEEGRGDSTSSTRNDG